MATELKQEILDRINKLFSDQSVSRRTTKDDLEEIRDEIEMYLDTLDGRDENEADL